MGHPVQVAAMQIREFLATTLGFDWASSLSPNLYVLILYVLIGAVTFVAVVLIPVLLVLMERKVAAYFQDRVGPTRIGPWGSLVTIADGIKLLFKEDLIPPEADRLLFRLAPYLVFGSAFAVFAVLPPFQSTVIGNLDIGLFLYIAISSLVVLGIIMAGWASNSKYSLFGAMRAAAQIVSYEIPLGLSILMIVMMTGTLNLQEIVLDQSGGLLRWYVFRQPFLFLGAFIYFLSAVAEVNRTPFDLPEAESEIVAGFHTEYSGIRFAYFFMAEYANMFIVSAILVTLFFGGWTSPIPGVALLPGILWFLFKVMLVVFTMMWIRWTLPRVRVDQLMNLCWKYLLPIAFVNVLGTGLIVLMERERFTFDIGGLTLSGRAVAWIVVPIVLILLGWFAATGKQEPGSSPAKS